MKTALLALGLFFSTPSIADRYLPLEYPALTVVAEKYCGLPMESAASRNIRMMAMIQMAEDFPELTPALVLRLIIRRAQEIEQAILLRGSVGQFCINIWKGDW